MFNADTQGACRCLTQIAGSTRKVIMDGEGGEWERDEGRQGALTMFWRGCGGGRGDGSAHIMWLAKSMAAPGAN